MLFQIPPYFFNVFMWRIRHCVGFRVLINIDMCLYILKDLLASSSQKLFLWCMRNKKYFSCSDLDHLPFCLSFLFSILGEFEQTLPVMFFYEAFEDSEYCFADIFNIIIILSPQIQISTENQAILWNYKVFLPLGLKFIHFITFPKKQFPFSRISPPWPHSLVQDCFVSLSPTCFMPFILNRREQQFIYTLFCFLTFEQAQAKLSSMELDDSTMTQY